MPLNHLLTTSKHLQVSGHSTKLEARLSGSIQRLQLDNQMLDASQPVVLAPASAAHAHSKTAQSLVGGDTALVTFGCTRSYANALAAAAEPSNRDGMEVSGNAMPASDVGVTRNWTEGAKMGDVQSAITSFKDIHLQIGEMDFQVGFNRCCQSQVLTPSSDRQLSLAGVSHLHAGKLAQADSGAPAGTNTAACLMLLHHTSVSCTNVSMQADCTRSLMLRQVKAPQLCELS